ncbi:hypothetical protein DPMN_031740 [Dreissena polymorpha]|uniref:Uncharacterized protein n=1 Tax=Dreissena polymorpha TaxID=45954 RepID=A0A9D4RJL5_DREPO|nr:hypothetical protein DPMN_031740 [Dreissena polymorpha]
MKSACDVAITKSEAAVTAALKNVYFAAKQNLASSVIPALNAHCINQGVSQLCDLRVDGHTTYEHHQSISEFQECIAESLHLELLDKLKHSPKFSLMLDESTDFSTG